MHRPDLTAKPDRKKEIAAWLEEALERDDFSFALQPQVDLRSREYSGTEVFLRWRGSPAGEISPAEFIPVAEECGLMPALGKWIFTNLCKLLGQWRKAGWRLPERLAVNISATQLADREFRAFLCQTINTYGLSAELFELEVTEEALMSEAGLEILKELKMDGFMITVDDYGTGFTSLSQTRSFTPDRLKIDMSFVRDMHHDDASYAVVSAIVSMAENFSMSVVAEGVETEKQASTLRNLGCDHAQGFLYSKPLSAETYCDDWMTRTVLQFSSKTGKKPLQHLKNIKPGRRHL